MNDNFSVIHPYFDLESLFNALPYLFWKNKEGKYQGSNLNQAINLGFNSPDDFVGKTIYEILDDQNSAKIIDQIDNTIMTQNKPLTIEEKILLPNGEEKFFLSQKYPTHDKKGNVIGLFGFAMDITEIKQMEIAVKLRAIFRTA